MHWRNPGVLAALAAAVLFGAGSPFAKLLLGEVSPWLLAGLLYLGSGVGLAIVRVIRRTRFPKIPANELRWLIAAVFVGGIIAPVLLMWGLTGMSASGASLLLNAEGVFTALVAWFVFRENFDRRIALGMALIIAGVAVLAWPARAGFGDLLPALSVLGACLAWALDNNFTRKVALGDATFIAMVKGGAAGSVNLALALAAGAVIPPMAVGSAAAMLGFASYGVSLVLFVIALRHLGTARAAAYFATAPFAGAVISIPLLNEAITVTLVASGFLMACGVWLHLTERHEHTHTHEALEHEHEHEHEHDVHHQHEHPHPVASGTRHAHPHRHEPITHTHTHFPDAHHRHRH